MPKNLTVGPLFRRSNAPDEARSLLGEFSQVVTNPLFPCFFASSAFKRDELFFGMTDVSSGLGGVVDLFDTVAEKIHTDVDQTVVLWLTEGMTKTLEDDRDLAARILNHLLASDPTPWPHDRSTDPAEATWDFWYKGVDFFVNVSTPHHHRRKSRNLGSAFTLVVQSRTSFDRLGDGAASARRKIRERIDQHDSIPRSLALGEHGAQPEIDQFFLWDANEPKVEHRLLTEADILLQKAAKGESRRDQHG